jgi:hypothetical protein
MRRFSLVCLLASLSLAIYAAGLAGAQAASVQEVFEKYNQIGTWAWDCSKPPSDNNRYYVNRVIDANHVQRDAMNGPTTRDHVSIIDKATPLGPNEIALGGTYDDKAAEAVWRVEGDRQTTTEFTLEGKKQISGGKLANNGRQMRSTNKCGAPARQGQAPVPENIQVAAGSTVRALEGGQGEPRTVQSGVKTQIATHDRFDKQCRPSRVEIKVIAPPANGTVSNEPQDVVIKAVNRLGEKQPSQCVGKTVTGVAVFYQSRPGFIGNDSFRYRRFNPNDASDRFNSEVGINVTVR